MFELTEGALVAASVDVVWADLTDATRLAEWFWPPRLEAETAVEARPLGAWRVHSAIADITVEARILAIDSPHSLRLEWRWAGEDHATDAEITLEAAADAATRVIVRHSGFVSAADRENHVEGWSDCLQRLVDRYA
jgi:uncharacterized protein YndB with AHSA1/START domain